MCFKQMDLSYQNFNRMVTNQTSSIRYENLDTLSTLLGCSVIGGAGEENGFVKGFKYAYQLFSECARK